MYLIVLIVCILLCVAEYNVQGATVSDAITRLSPRCCQRLAEGNAVQVLLTLLRSCNRSVPHQEILKHSVSVLLNLVKVS